MNTPKRLSLLLLLALLAFGLTTQADAQSANPAQNKKGEELVRANRSEASENATQPDSEPQSDHAPKRAPRRERRGQAGSSSYGAEGSPSLWRRSSDLRGGVLHSEPTGSAQNNGALDSFDAFPAAAAKRPIPPRAVSENVAAQLAARMPQYTPPPEPKPKPDDQDAPDGELADMRDTDRPKNQILRLPDYVVREKKSPILRERDIHSPSGLAALAANRYLSETGQALNRFRLPLIGSAAQAYALARYEEDERLRNIRDLNDTARDLGQLQNAQASSSGDAVPTWGTLPASHGASARRATDAEASLRRLIRDTTSRRATEPPSKLAQ
ncbi:hypothetical protein AXK12_05200 [Cephaloticoccus capnophilus]|uniref:Uncharacterized protein n=1 Tax=Cephaloticoccus capnophilus TaxID=1548208 RepID=A0A139SLK2_9BACT|nr:hypothetical protein [Cephaloticoccus capnophilus]KXU35370.1 hypothetical protein AXK12_05200 [Cephaloticoccus capnophilus]